MMDIREERPHDQKAIFHVVSCAFAQEAEAQLIERLRGDGDIAISLVAEEDDQLVGHVLLSRLGAPFPALALAPVSVIPTKQRSGIGSTLIDQAVRRARNNGSAAIFVLVIQVITNGLVFPQKQPQVSALLMPAATS